MAFEIPKLINIEQEAGGWLKKYLLTYQNADGSTFNYDSVSRKDLDEYWKVMDRGGAPVPYAPDAVCIVPFTDDGKIILIREYRYPVNSWCIAFPAGLKEPGEDIEYCADRELEEELGYRLARDENGKARMRVLAQSGYSSVGMTEENVQTIFAVVEKVGEPNLEPNELIEHFELAYEDVRDFLNTNKLPLGIRTQFILEMWNGELPLD